MRLIFNGWIKSWDNPGNQHFYGLRGRQEKGVIASWSIVAENGLEVQLNASPHALRHGRKMGKDHTKKRSFVSGAHQGWSWMWLYMTAIEIFRCNPQRDYHSFRHETWDFDWYQIYVTKIRTSDLTWTRMLSIRFPHTKLPKGLKLDSKTIQVNIHIEMTWSQLGDKTCFWDLTWTCLKILQSKCPVKSSWTN